jgi:hypothetical protein
VSNRQPPPWFLAVDLMLAEAVEVAAAVDGSFGASGSKTSAVFLVFLFIP